MTTEQVIRVESIGFPLAQHPAQRPGYCFGCVLYERGMIGCSKVNDAAQAAGLPRCTDEPNQTYKEVVLGDPLAAEADPDHGDPEVKLTSEEERDFADIERINTQHRARDAALYKPAHGGYPEGAAMPLASDAALARTTDPQTSHDAAEKVGGGKLVDIILSVMGRSGGPGQAVGWTGKELAWATGRPLNSLTPRFAPMRRAGLIHPAGKRDKQIVWKLGNGVAA